MNNNSLPSPMGGALNWLNQNVVQPVGSYVSNLPVTNLPGSQTWGGAFQGLVKGLESLPGEIQAEGEAAQKKAYGQPLTQQDQEALARQDTRAYQSMGLVMGTLGGDIKGVNPDDFPAGTSFIRDEKGNLHVQAHTASDVPFTAPASEPGTPFTPQAPQQGDIVENQSTPYPFSKKTGSTSGQNQNVRQIRLPASIGGAQSESAINDTLDRLGFSGDAATQYGQLQPKMSQLNDYVQNELEANPKSASLDEVKQAFNNKLNDLFVSGEITKPAAQQAANSYINRLYDAALPNATPDNIVPENIDTPTLYKMKVMANQQARPLFKILDNGGALSENQKVIMANRNALDDVIAKYHPNVKQATTDMSNLYDAASSLEKARFSPPEPFSLTQATLGQDLSKFVPPIVKAPIDVAARAVGKLSENPSGKLALAGLTGAGVLAGAQQIPNLINNFSTKNYSSADQGGQPSNQNVEPSSIHDVGNIPQSMQNINTNEQLPNPSQITDTSGNPLTVDPQTFKQEKSQIDSEVQNYQQLGVPVPQSVLQKQQYLDQSDPNNPNSLNHVYQRDSVAYGAASNAMSLLDNVSPNFFNLFKSYDDFQKNTDPQYAALKTAFSNLYAYNPQSTQALFTAGSKYVAVSELQQAMKGIAWDYYQTINTYTGGGQQAPSEGGLPPIQSTQKGLPPVQSAPQIPTQSTGGISGGLPTYQYSGGQWTKQ